MNDFLLQDVEGKSPLHCAIENGHQEIINMLLAETGLELCSRDKSGLTPFATGQLVFKIFNSTFYKLNRKNSKLWIRNS